MEPSLKIPLKQAVEFLEKHGFGYAVIGGIALSQWGVIRTTRDVDIKVLVPDTEYETIRKTILKAFPNPARRNTPENPLILSVTIEDVIVDFLLALPGYEELIIDRAKKRELDGLTVWICSAEDLIIQKAVAGRGRDWPDIEALLVEQRGMLDEAYIDKWLTQFAAALEKPEMLTEYQRVRQKISDIANS